MVNGIQELGGGAGQGKELCRDLGRQGEEDWGWRQLRDEEGVMVGQGMTDFDGGTLGNGIRPQ